MDWLNPTPEQLAEIQAVNKAMFERRLAEEKEKQRIRDKARHIANPEKERARYLKYDQDNRDERRVKAQRYRDENQQKYYESCKWSGIKRRYKLTKQQWFQMLADQGGVCKICGAQAPGGKGEWHVDHCHATKINRGLLCHGCNTGLGGFKDNPVFMRVGANYVEWDGEITESMEWLA